MPSAVSALPVQAPPAPPIAPRRTLSLLEAAAYLHVGPRTIRRWAHRSHDPIPASKPGRRLYFDIDEIEAWLRRHQARPTLATPRKAKRSTRRPAR